MWSSDLSKWAGVAALTIVVAACGFRPLHEKPSNAGVTELESIKISPIANRSGQILRNELLVRITPEGTPDAPRYVLKVDLRETTRDLAIRRDEVATRANLTITANYTLLGSGDGKPVTNGVVRSTVSYNILDEQFATISSRANARDRGVRQLSDEIRARLAIALSRRSPSK